MSRPSGAPAVGWTVLAAVAFLAAVALVALRTRTHLSVPGDANAAGHYGMQDFRDAIYYPVVALLDGRNPYDAADYVRRYSVATPLRLYLPAMLGLYLPFGFLPYTAAAAVFFAVNVALVPLLVYQALSLADVRVTAPRVLGLAAGVILSRPGLLTLFVGQCAIYMTLGLCVAWRYARTRPLLAALGVALTALKPTYGLPLGVLLLGRGAWRPVIAGGALAALVTAAVGVPLARAAGGVGPWIASLRASAGMSDDPHNVIVQSYFRVDAASLLGRLVQVELSPAVQVLLLLVVVGLGLAAVRRLARDGEPHAPLAAGVVGVTTLACVYHQTYDCLLLLVPFFASVAGRIGSGRGRWALAALSLVPFGNYFATLTLISRLGEGGAAWLAVAALNSAAVVGVFVLLLREAARAGAADLTARR
jgi:glycosyl transferase family 87